MLRRDLSAEDLLSDWAACAEPESSWALSVLDCGWSSLVR